MSDTSPSDTSPPSPPSPPTSKTAKTARPSRFPRAYLLQLYNAAIDHGHVLVNPISQSDAKSLTQTFYRLRRRSDTSNAQFIRPEFFLVTVAPWTPDNGGTLPVMYSSTGDDSAPLPNIIPAGSTTPLPLIEPELNVPPVADIEDPLPPGPFPAASPTASALPPEEDLDAFLSTLISKANKHTSEESSDDDF